jgi:acetyl-CoA carboxylase biotin carboxyl carrier protein
MATEILAPLDGKIVRIFVNVGKAVEEDEPIAMIKALKNEMPISSPIDGTVEELRVKEGESVQTDALIAVIEKS